MISKIKQNIAFWFLTLLLLIYRGYVLALFGFKYTDTDQTVMWLGTKNYAEGNFHEPGYYGQNYNTLLEAFLAVPFYKMGLKQFIILPIITTILTLIPFLILSFKSSKNGRTTESIIILSILATLPIEYDLITSLPRGFVTGIAVFSIVFFLQKNGKFDEFNHFGIAFSLAIVAYVANPNSALLSFPILGLLFLNNYRGWHFYKNILLGILVILPGLLLFFGFYYFHSNFVMHSYQITFSANYLVNSLKHLDDYFRMLTPFLWKQGFLSLVFPFLFATYFLWKKKRNIAIICLLIPFLYLLPMSMSKIHDGTDSVFFHVSRMYLALPVVLAFLISNIEIKWRKNNLLFVIIPISFLTYKSVNLIDSIEANMNKPHILAVGESKDLIKECKKINDFSNKNNIGLIIFLNHLKSEFYDYGCAACEPEMPNTIYPLYERRTWRLIEDEKRVYKDILLFDTKRNLQEEFTFIDKTDFSEYAFVITNNHFTTSDLYEKLNIQVRRY